MQQRLRVTLGYDGSLKELPVYVTGTNTIVKDAKGLPPPHFVLPAGGNISTSTSNPNGIIGGWATVGAGLGRPDNPAGQRYH